MKTKKKETTLPPINVPRGEAYQLGPAEGAARPPGEFKLVPRRMVRPDPNQPRKDFNEQALEELAWSIFKQGIVQPILVKLVPGLKIKEPDMIEKEWQAVDAAGATVFQGGEDAVKQFAEGKTEDLYQIIAGERRYRGSGGWEFKPEPGRNEEPIKWTGLEQLPVIVRQDVSEHDTFALQHIENLQRVNLSALEDAQSFARELQKRKLTDPTITPEKLGAELGLKRSTVYNRLKLLRLHEPVRQALLKGEIETSHAIALATIPDPKKQTEKLEEILERADYEGLVSVRNLEEEIESECAKPLKGAPFDLEDGKLFSPRWRVVGPNGTEVILAPENGRGPVIPLSRQVYISDYTEDDGYGHRRKVYSLYEGKSYAQNFIDRNGRGTGEEVVTGIGKAEASDLKDLILAGGTLVVERHSGGSCGDCPHRSGNLNPDAKNPNVCTLPGCFAAKVKAHWVNKATELQAKGTVVLSEAEFRKEKGKFVPGDRHEYTNSRSGTFEELMGKHKPEPTLVATAEGIKKFYPREEAITAAKKNGVKFYDHHNSAPQTKEEKAKEEAQRKAREELRKQRFDLAVRLMPELAEGLAALKDKDAWALAAETIGKHFSWSLIRDELQKCVTKTKNAKAIVLGYHLANCNPVSHDGKWDKEAVDLWQRAGVDLLAAEKKATPAPTQELPLEKAQPKQKELAIATKSKKAKKGAALKKK